MSKLPSTRVVQKKVFLEAFSFDRPYSIFSSAVRSGSHRMVDDLRANHGRPWGFPPDEISVPVHSWSCRLDRSVSPAMGRHICDTIPHCRAEAVPDAGYLWILEHVNEVLRASASSM
ncbi:MAG: hypothetical protein WD423_10730 [Rhodothermales bacterium]